MNGVEQCLPCLQHTSYGRQAAPPTNESGMARLLADDDYDERIGLHFAAALAWSRRIKIGGWHKDVVRLGVEAHGAGAALGGDIFHHGEFVGGVFMHNGENAVLTAGSEEVVRSGIEG